MFVRNYNRYTRKNNLKHSNKNLIKFEKYNPPKKRDEKKKEEWQVTCYNCVKLRNIKIDCQSLVKHNEK